MAKYEIQIKLSAAKEIESIERKSDRKRILDCIKDLGNNPRPNGIEKLTGQDRYRIREGNYRILYTITDKKLIVCIVKVGNRKDVYRH